LLETSVLPCTDEGIRNAVAAGGGPYTFECDGSTRVVAQAEIVINNDVILDGEGNLIVDGPEEGGSFFEASVLHVNEGVTAELYGVAVVDSGFRGIVNEGTLTLANVIVSGNAGGGLGNEETGVLMGTDLTLADNDALNGDGGGLYNAGILMLSDSTVSRNRSGGGGGGILNSGEMATIVNTTISGNTSMGAEGGGISSEGALTMTACTVSGNTSADGGSISNVGSMTLSNTLIDGDCGGTTGLAVPQKTPTSAGYNIESPGNTCGLDEPSDQTNVTAEQLALEPLADNGGLTQTHALDAGSVAIDVIPVDSCEVDTDQRGEPRPGGTMCDVGAFEVQP